MAISLKIQSEVVYMKCKNSMNIVRNRRQNLRSALLPLLHLEPGLSMTVYNCVLFTVNVPKTVC